MILDVFNILHGADENDNTEMRKVLEELNRIHREIGCGVGVVHHFNKSIEGTLTQRLRGAGAIAGWAEWLIGVEAEDQNVGKIQLRLRQRSHQSRCTSEYRKRITTTGSGSSVPTGCQKGRSPGGVERRTIFRDRAVLHGMIGQIKQTTQS